MQQCITRLKMMYQLDAPINQALNRMTIVKRRDGPEPTIDQEQHFILRLPRSATDILNHDIEAAVNLKDKLSIELKPDHRHSVVRYAGQVYQGRIVDLPCILETLKTTDRRTFYKAADISQLMICSQGEETSPSASALPSSYSASTGGDQPSSGAPPANSKDPVAAGKPNQELQLEKQYHYNHGVTRPLKNVRKRRFRKTMKKKYVDMPDIEKEVKQLLRVDLEAAKVTCTVVYANREEAQTAAAASEADQTASSAADGGGGGGAAAPLHSRLEKGDKASRKEKGSRNLISIAAAEIFGEVSSSEDEGEAEAGGEDLDQDQEDLDHLHHGHLHQQGPDEEGMGDPEDSQLGCVLDSAVAEAGLDLQSQFFVEQADVSNDRDYEHSQSGFAPRDDDFELSMETEEEDEGRWKEEDEPCSSQGDEEALTDRNVSSLDSRYITRPSVDIKEENVDNIAVQRLDQAMATLRTRISIAEDEFATVSAGLDEDHLAPHISRSILEMKRELEEQSCLRDDMAAGTCNPFIDS